MRARGRAAITAEWLAEQHLDDAGGYDAHYEPIAIDGDIVVTHGRTRFRDPATGAIQVVYDNVWVLRFGPDGRCSEFHEWYSGPPDPRTWPGSRPTPPSRAASRELVGEAPRPSFIPSSRPGRHSGRVNPQTVPRAHRGVPDERSSDLRSSHPPSRPQWPALDQRRVRQPVRSRRHVRGRHRPRRPSTTTTTTACGDTHWPASVQGVPTNLKSGGRAGDYIWHSSTGWHLRATHAGHGEGHLHRPDRLDHADHGDAVPAREERLADAECGQAHADVPVRELRPHRRPRLHDRLRTQARVRWLDERREAVDEPDLDRTRREGTRSRTRSRSCERAERSPLQRPNGGGPPGSPPSHVTAGASPETPHDGRLVRCTV